MQYISLFSGIGGFELSMQQATERFTCVGFSEINRHAIHIYQKHFPGHTSLGDITSIDAQALPRFDLLVGGFPCQAFSLAGKRGGFSDTRGTLFFEIARLLKYKRPRLFLLENVKGLLSHNGSATFATIIHTLVELGYDLQWQVLNSKNHGVPQNRERVFIVGHLGGTPRPEVFPLGQDGERTHEAEPTFSGDVQAERSKRQQSSSDSLKLELGKNRSIHQLNAPTHSNNRVYGANGICPTLNTMQGGMRQPFVRIPEAKKKGYAEATVG